MMDACCVYGISLNRQNVWHGTLVFPNQMRNLQSLGSYPHAIDGVIGVRRLRQERATTDSGKKRLVSVSSQSRSTVPVVNV